MSVLIIGYGNVGSNLKTELAAISPSVTDKYKGIAADGTFHDFGFVCVDTPLGKGGMLDASEVENAVNENDCGVYVIKSTVPVGFTDYLKKKTGKRVVFSPEYYGTTQHCNNFDFDFTILGGEPRDVNEVQQALQNCYDARHKFMRVDSKTAELAKFMENSWLAYKVTFCCEFARIADTIGVDYEQLRECFILDPRVNPSHTFVYRDHPYYRSHCLDKDVPHITKQSDSELLRAIIDMNKKFQLMSDGTML